MANRHLSRSIVLQTLFEWDFLPEDQKVVDPTGDKIKEVLKRNLKEFAPGFEDDAFVFSLTEKILKKRVTIDEIIEKAAPDWPIDKISIIDRNILRIGLTELLFGDRKEVPPKVAITPRPLAAAFAVSALNRAKSAADIGPNSSRLSAGFKWSSSTGGCRMIESKK